MPNLVLKTIMRTKKVYGAEIFVFTAPSCGATSGLSLSAFFTVFLALLAFFMPGPKKRGLRRCPLMSEWNLRETFFFVFFSFIYNSRLVLLMLASLLFTHNLLFIALASQWLLLDRICHFLNKKLSSNPSGFTTALRYIAVMYPLFVHMNKTTSLICLYSTTIKKWFWWSQRSTEQKSASPWRVYVALLPVFQYQAIFAHFWPFWIFLPIESIF